MIAFVQAGHGAAATAAVNAEMNNQNNFNFHQRIPNPPPGGVPPAWPPHNAAQNIPWPPAGAGHRQNIPWPPTTSATQNIPWPPTVPHSAGSNQWSRATPPTSTWPTDYSASDMGTERDRQIHLPGSQRPATAAGTGTTASFQAPNSSTRLV